MAAATLICMSQKQKKNNNNSKFCQLCFSFFRAFQFALFLSLWAWPSRSHTASNASSTEREHGSQVFPARVVIACDLPHNEKRRTNPNNVAKAKWRERKHAANSQQGILGQRLCGRLAMQASVTPQIAHPHRVTTPLLASCVPAQTNELLISRVA